MFFGVFLFRILKNPFQIFFIVLLILKALHNPIVNFLPCLDVTDFLSIFPIILLNTAQGFTESKHLVNVCVVKGTEV